MQNVESELMVSELDFLHFYCACVGDHLMIVFGMIHDIFGTFSTMTPVSDNPLDDLFLTSIQYVTLESF